MIRPTTIAQKQIKGPSSESFPVTMQKHL